MLKFALLSLLVSSPAFAFYTAELKLEIRRDNVHYTAPVPVTDSRTLFVRYDATGSCFIPGVSDDYACEVQADYSMVNNPVIRMKAASFLALADTSLQWNQPEFLPEFRSLAKIYESEYVVFTTTGLDRDTSFPMVVFSGQTLKTPDGKTSYTGSLTGPN